MKENLNLSLDDNGNILEVDMIRPSNFHAHLRDEELMQAVAFDIMRWVKYLLVMPNTGPIDTIEKLKVYREKLLKIRDEHGLKNEFVMTLYFTDLLNADVLKELSAMPFSTAVKYYPPHKGATTGAGAGIHFSTDKAKEILEAMTEHNVKLLGHFESVYDKDDNELPHAEREGYFMDHEYDKLRAAHPDLEICIEHISTKKSVEKVKADSSGKTACTITPQHLLFTVDDLERKSWRNHLKCMPFVKTKEDRQALLNFATSGDSRAILGDDTAPHPSMAKTVSFEEAACGTWLPHSLSLYIMAFHLADSLNENFIKFACMNGPDWWKLPRPETTDRVRVVRETEKDIPDPNPIPNSDDVVIPLGWTEEADRLKIGHALEESED